MVSWVIRGLRTGIKTSHYPARQDDSGGVSPGRPAGRQVARGENANALVARCPTGAITQRGDATVVNSGRCVHCFRCKSSEDGPGLPWESGYEWASYHDDASEVHKRLGRSFGHSLHIRFIDAGACGACMSEARQLNSPYYNIHRLGFLMTPTPRNADVLMVAGPVCDAMLLPLQRAYEAMPPPKRVIAIGACAISGGVFGPSFISFGGVSGVLPVDVVVPGCPPPPLAILHGILVLVDRKPPAPPALTSNSARGPS